MRSQHRAAHPRQWPGSLARIMCLNKPSAREQLFSSYCLTKKTFMTPGKEQDLGLLVCFFFFLYPPSDLRAAWLRDNPSSAHRGAEMLLRAGGPRALPQASPRTRQPCAAPRRGK